MAAGVPVEQKAADFGTGRDPRHPGLQSHEFDSMSGILGEKVFESYAEQNTPAAYRVFWHYGPGKHKITIVAISSHL